MTIEMNLVNWIYACMLLVFLIVFSQSHVIYNRELLQENARIQREIKVQFLSSYEVSYQYYRIICNNLKKMYLFVCYNLMCSDAKWPNPSEKPRFDYRVVKELAKKGG